jgi:hypothetical protein
MACNSGRGRVNVYVIYGTFEGPHKGVAMAVQEEKWMTLCRQLESESDLGKVLIIAEALIHELDAERERLRAARTPPTTPHRD